MKNRRVTIQDIAEELNLSRNTVSKALNGTGNVSDKTKKLIFQKAVEMGYKAFPMLSAPLSSEEEPVSNREIALFTCSMLGTQNINSTFLDSFQKKMSHMGYRLTIYMLREDVISSCAFPENFNREQTDGVLVLELFDKKYTDFLCSQNIPTLFVDSYANTDHDRISSDVLYVESENSSFQIVRHMLESGCKRIGFVGDRFHCQSFYERWNGYEKAMLKYGHTDCHSYSILEDDHSPYIHPKWLGDKIQALPALPDAFFCANDFLAICTIKALKQLGHSLPATVRVAGFDNSVEAKIIEPALTTVTIYSRQMGYLATDMLLKRIKYFSLPFTTVYAATQPVYRASTETE